MLKPFYLPVLLFLFLPLTGFSQCQTAPPAPACNGTEPLLTDNETLGGGTTKWYYGSTTTMNSLTLQGGTLVVCADLTIDKLYMDNGVIFIRPGARFVIGSGIGAGLQLKGDCAIYNYGTCEVQRNLTLENNAAAATPNIVINATTSSIFKMPNQYFVINNAFSWFINNGRAEFWGLITDQLASAGSVCLGSGSNTKMAVLINRIANSYVVPDGNACVHVFQFSQFYNPLTSSPTLFACLGSGHTSDAACIPFGCTPNNWGAAQIFSNCTGCGAIAALSARFISFTAKQWKNRTNKLQWHVNADLQEGVFIVLRSADGQNYKTIDSVIVKPGGGSLFYSLDKSPLPGNNYYMIRYTNNREGADITSKIAMVFSEPTGGLHFYPVPFDDKFFINYLPGAHPEKIILTDMNGKDIPTRYIIHEESRLIEVFVLEKIQAGIYIVHMRTDKNIVAKTIFKK